MPRAPNKPHFITNGRARPDFRDANMERSTVVTQGVLFPVLGALAQSVRSFICFFSLPCPLQLCTHRQRRELKCTASS